MRLVSRCLNQLGPRAPGGRLPKSPPHAEYSSTPHTPSLSQVHPALAPGIDFSFSLQTYSTILRFSRLHYSSLPLARVRPRPGSRDRRPRLEHHSLGLDPGPPGPVDADSLQASVSLPSCFPRCPLYNLAFNELHTRHARPRPAQLGDLLDQARVAGSARQLTLA